jgi:ribonuclease P/MRP protein subunit POP8
MATSKMTQRDSSTTTSFTLRNPPYAYFHLSIRSLQFSQSSQSLDEITARSYLTAALQQYLGLMGTAIAIDILKVEGAHIWIRVPRDDESAVTAALSQWCSSAEGSVSLRVEARGSWLGGVAASGGATNAKLWSLER